jgi:hypothetical protein
MADIADLRIFAELNPWWTSREVPSHLTGLPRPLYLEKIKKDVDKDEITILSGIRRAGKTTLLYQLTDHLLTSGLSPRNILLVNCDEVILGETFQDIHSILSAFNDSASGKKYVMLDEVQYFSKWELQLKNAFDRFRGQIKIIVSGSSAVLTKSKDLYHLTGRSLPISLFPMSFPEFLQMNGIGITGTTMEEKYKICAPLNLDSHLQKYLLYGGFPRIIAEESVEEKQRLAKLYYETIIYKDIIRLWEIKDVAALERLGRFLLQHIGQRFSYRKISDALGTNLQTTQNYIEYLSNSFLVYLIPYYSADQATRIKKEKKVFAIDNILHTAYFDSQNPGALAENLVFIHLLKRGQLPTYWKDKVEVDFIIEHAGRPVPLEIKYQNTISKEDFKGLASFFRKHEKADEGILITRDNFGNEDVGGKKVRLVPLWLFLLELPA